MRSLAKDFFSGQVLNELFREFNVELKKINYDFSTLKDTEPITLIYEFGPNDTSNLKESFVKHKKSNFAQLFVGGTRLKARIKDGNLILQVTNFTSRSSLLFHLFGVKNYSRKNNRNRPLSTIQQNIKAKFKINK